MLIFLKLFPPFLVRVRGSSRLLNYSSYNLSHINSFVTLDIHIISMMNSIIHNIFPTTLNDLQYTTLDIHTNIIHKKVA